MVLFLCYFTNYEVMCIRWLYNIYDLAMIFTLKIKYTVFGAMFKHIIHLQ